MLKFLNNMKDIIMARPKGSSNKTKTEKPVEFDYEEEAERSNSAPLQLSISQAPSDSLSDRLEFDYSEDEGAPMPVQIQTTYAQQPSVMPNLFLINGRVRMERAGSAPIEAEQQRIVYASNFVEAVAKYNAYFTSLSSPGERYTVIGAGGSEAIR